MSGSMIGGLGLPPDKRENGHPFVEGRARVVAVDKGIAWLEPEQTGSCGGCASAALCGSKGLGTLTSRLQARRFPLPDGAGLHVGDRVIVGVREDALVKASMTAYALPLATCFAAGALAQAVTHRDGITMAASAAGLLVGLVLARIFARVLETCGEIAPRLVRRDAPACHPEQG
ncbi:SoxR reducing system RseC family protein [Azoarcus sp. DN11]|uniref:SoxR reducing system RseC family protein n=1 Tax=Azoarcus sp. DN11 TaxID=356837 RepID=UPI002570F66D|nr:SoxR reducing system RseC family protein [Azoarcus sp. DN11]